MTEPVSSSSSSSSPSSSSSSPGMTIDLRPMIEDVSQVMTKHITTILSGVIGEYTIFKETHDTIMGLPCVRKLQQRISELEHGDGGGGSGATKEVHLTASGANGSNSREDEVAQLQSAIAEMNRYIVALESRVDMKAVCLSKAGGETEKETETENDEESVRLEIHEEDDASVEESADVSFTVSSAHKNVIISNTDTITVEEEAEEAEEAEEEEGDGQVEDSEDDAVAAEDAEAEEAAVEEEVEAEVEEEVEEEAAEEVEAEEAEEEAAEEEAAEEAEAEEEAEEAKAEEEAEEEAAEEEEAEEAEIEVSEVKIKGKMYFTTDPQNGIIYACVDEDVGDEVGVFKNGVAVFNKGKK